MGKNSGIQWTDHTFNPWMGCTKVSPGCEHCYAEADRKRRGQLLWGPKAPRQRTSVAYWKEPMRWNDEAARLGIPARVFCGSLCDIAEDRDDLLEARADLMRLIEKTPMLEWLLLTKRPENFNRFFGNRWGQNWPKNVWALASVTTQKEADRLVPELMRVPAAVRGLSMEPLLEAVSLAKYLPARWLCSGCGHRTNDDIGRCKGYCQDPTGASCDAVACPGCGKRHYWTGSMANIHWAIVGGESGGGARPFMLEWAWSLVQECQAAGVAPFVKQLGAKSETANLNLWDLPDHVEAWGPSRLTGAAGAALKFADKKAGEWSEWPDELKVREFPRAR